MTVITVKRRGGNIVSVNANGHTGYGAEGEDIVCAALSAVIQTAGLGLLHVAKIPADIRTEEGAYSITMPDKTDKSMMMRAESILETMMLGLKDLESGYPEYIKIKEITGA